MKLPSLFRTPRHQRYHIEPRYYDPVKERVEKQTERMKRKLEASEGSEGQYQTNIRGTFARRKKEDTKQGLLRFVLFLVITGTFAGYLFFGNDVFYVYLILFPIYLFFRLKKSFFRS
jgi:hypothetical protein